MRPSIISEVDSNNQKERVGGFGGKGCIFRQFR
jgi:hypothetical protein